MSQKEYSKRVIYHKKREIWIDRYKRRTRRRESERERKRERRGAEEGEEERERERIFIRTSATTVFLSARC